MRDTDSERSKRYTAKQRERGLVPVKVWVPPEYREEIKQVAAVYRGDKSR